MRPHFGRKGHDYGKTEKAARFEGEPSFCKDLCAREVLFFPDGGPLCAAEPRPAVAHEGGADRFEKPGERGRAEPDRKSTRLNSSHSGQSRMPSSA